MNLTAVWGTSFANVFAASSEGDVVHFDGALWKSVYYERGSSNVLGLWGSSPTDVYAVGRWGWTLHHTQE
jgi:hypothetical protein